MWTLCTMQLQLQMMCASVLICTGNTCMHHNQEDGAGNGDEKGGTMQGFRGKTVLKKNNY